MDYAKPKIINELKQRREALREIKRLQVKAHTLDARAKVFKKLAKQKKQQLKSLKQIAEETGSSIKTIYNLGCHSL